MAGPRSRLGQPPGERWVWAEGGAHPGRRSASVLDVHLWPLEHGAVVYQPAPAPDLATSGLVAACAVKFTIAGTLYVIEAVILHLVGQRLSWLAKLLIN